VSDLALAPMGGIGAVVLAGFGLILLFLSIATGRWPVWVASYIVLVAALILALLAGRAGGQPGGDWGVSDDAPPHGAVAMRTIEPDGNI
jgi:hypothetical protein